MSFKPRPMCGRGHLLDDANTHVAKRPGGKYMNRICRACARLRMRKVRSTPEGKAANLRMVKRWRKANPQRYKAINDKTKNWFKDYKKTLHCVRCGEDRTPCLDFHHRDDSQKEFGIGVLAGGSWSVARVKREIAKCDVLCSNCHRWHHHLLRQAKAVK